MKKNIFLLLILFSISLYAKKWDAIYINKLLAAKEYDKLINYYKSLYDDVKKPQPEMAFKIADLYTKKKDYNSALYWYNKESQLLRENKVNLLNMANTYKIKGDYQKALDIYLAYAAETGDAKKVLEDAYLCEKLIRANAFQENYVLEKYGYNTPADEINIKILRNNIVYQQYINTDNEKNKKLQEQTFLHAQRKYDGWNQPKKIINTLEKDKIYSTFSFSKDGNTAAFSMKNKPIQDGKSKSMSSETEKIYLASFLGGNFVGIKPFVYNSENYNLSQPCLNENGTVLYFVSNMSGTNGGNDIFSSEFKDGKWTKPQNLGKLLNSKSQEQNPFFTKNNNKEYLYFSSDRPGGFGEFDIYEAEFANGSWQDVKLLHAPINTPNNENSYVYDFESQTAYVSSDRPNGIGGFDIYRILPFYLNAVVNLSDSTTNEAIEYAYLELFENYTKANDGVTNTDGLGKIALSKNKNYTLNITKEGYQPKTIKFNTFNKLNGDSLLFSEKMILNDNYSLKNSVLSSSATNYILFRGNFTDLSTNKQITPIVRIVNVNTNKVRTIEYDDDGYFNLKLMTNNNYNIIIEYNSLKIKDEITTYGLEHGSVKMKKYLLSGTKYKTSEDRVLKPLLVDDSLKLVFFDENKIVKPTKTIKNNDNIVVNVPSKDKFKNEEIKKNKLDISKYEIVEPNTTAKTVEGLSDEENIQANNNIPANQNIEQKFTFKNTQPFDLDNDLEIPDDKLVDEVIENIETKNSIENNPFYYKIQIGSYAKENLNLEKFSKLGNIELQKSYNQYIYRLGNYDTKEEAMKILNEVRAEGYYLAFILHYINDNIIGIIK